MSDTSILERLSRSEAVDRKRGTVVWLRTWVALGSIVIFVVIAYLIFISNSLAGINGNLQVARDAVTDVSGNTKTLPSQIDAVTRTWPRSTCRWRPSPDRLCRFATT